MRKYSRHHRSLSVLSSLILLLILVPVVIVFAATVPAEINLSFTPIAIASGGTSTLRISVYNLNANPLTNATWTDTFPSGMTVANPPNLSQTCGGTVTDGSGGALGVGDSSIRLTNGTVPEQQPSGLPGECYVEVDVTSTTPGNLINTIPANHLSSQTEDPESPGSSVEITNTTPASATLNVIGVESPSLSKAFAPNTVFVGETSTLTITIHNNDDDYPLTEVTMFDVLPTNGNGDIKVASPPNATLSGCGEGSGAELTDESGTSGSLGPDDTTIKLVDGTIDPNADCVISVDVVSLVQGAYTNEIPGDDPGAGSIQTQQGVTNEDPADDPLNVQAFTIAKDFTETTLAAGQTTEVTIEIVNNATIDYTGAALDDILPDGLVFEPGSASLSCTDGSSTASFSYLQDTNPGDTLSMTGAVLPAKTTCTITATARAMMSATVGTYTNQIPIGALTTTQGAINHGSTSDSLDVVSLSLTKDFAETEITIGGTSLVTITISNPSPQDFTNASLVDVLPEGLVFVDDGSASTTCPGGSVSIGTDTEPNDQLTLSGADLPGGSLSSPGTCSITATVQADPSKAPGNHENLIPAGAIITDEGGTNADPASDTINVTGLEISKDFSPTTFAAGQTTTLTITITNPASIPFTAAGLSDTLPDSPNDELYFTGTPSTTCGAGTVVYSGTFKTVTLSNGTIPANASCTITATVTTDPDAPAANNYNNVIPSGSLVTTEGATNDSPANAIVNVDTVRVTKGYNVGTIAYPDTAILTITIQNLANGGVLTGISLSDTLPVGLAIVSDLDAADTTCDFSSTPTLVGTAGTRIISLSNGSLDAAPSSCTIEVEVTAERSASSGVYTNTIGVGDLTTAEGPTNSGSASTSLQVQAVSVDKDFQFAGFEAGVTNDLTITLTNHTGGDYTNAAVDDVLPQSPNQALYYTGTPTTTCSSGSVSIATTNYANDTVSFTGGTIPANSTCTITATITTDLSATDASYTNIIPVNALTTSIPSGAGPTNTVAATAPVYVYNETQGVTIDKTFTPSSIDIFENSLLRLIFTAPPDTQLTDFSFTDNLPAGVTVSNSNPPTASNCGTLGGDWPPVIGATSISATGGTIPRGESCTVDVYVTSEAGTTPGAIYTNTITPDDVSNTEDRNPPGDVTADLTVTTPSTLTMEKDFDPNIVGPEGRSRLTITLENSDTTELVDVSFQDVLPGDTSNGVVIASTPNPTTTCGSGVISFPDSQTIQMTGGTIPASDGTVNGICTINVTVQGKTTDGTNPATYTNTIPVLNVVATLAGTSSTMNPQNPASDDLTVKDLDLEIVKGFNPILVYGGADSVMSITLRNPNDDAELNDITFTDSMPAGDMILVDPPNFDPSDCGPAAELTRIDASTFHFSGGYLAAGAECTITLSANMTVNGNRTNTIPAEAVTTTNGATNKTATDATLTNLASVSVSKSFEPNPIASGLGSYSILTIEIRTTEAVEITGLGLVDDLPPGLQVADYVSGPAPAPTNGCGGTLSAPVDSTTITLSNGGLGIGFAKCILTIPVAGADPGEYTNEIPQGSLTNNEKITNIRSTKDTLTLTPYSLGNRVWYDVNNDGQLEPGEGMVAGVKVDVYRDNGITPGEFDASDTFIGTETTDANGYYRFDDLGGGDYVVLIPGDNFNSGNPLAGYYSSGTTLADDGTISDSIGPDPDDDADNDDNGMTTVSSGTVAYVSAQAITLGPDQSEPTADDDPSTNPETGEAINEQSNRTVDFGFYTITLGNLVWNDADNSGAVNGSEAGIDNVDVELWTADESRLLDTVTTAGGGNYSFTGLAAGNYIVRIPAAAFQGSEPLRDFVSSTGNGEPAPDGDINTTDSDDNGTEMTPPPLGSGGYIQAAEVTLTPAGEASFDSSTGTTSEPRIDFGVTLNPPHVKLLTGSDQAFTAGQDVAIGEILTYQVTLAVPPGAMSGVTLTDTMDRGLVFDECVSITAGSTDLTTSAAADFDTICATPPTVNTYPGGSTNPADPGRQVIFDFGTLTNAGATAVDLVVTYQAVVLDNLENQSGIDLGNLAVWSWNGFTLQDSAARVTVREPDLLFSKTVSPGTALPGQAITFTLTVDHSAATETPAFDVVLSDTIPAGLTYIPGSLQYVSGQVPNIIDDSSAPTLTVVWDQLLNNGTNSVISFDVTLDSTLRRGARVTNTASLSWTSLPEDNFVPPLSAYNPLSTERDYDPASAVNVYGLEASATIRIPRLPETGFAPGVVSSVPSQPADYQYGDLGDIQLVIPDLDISLPILSIPQNEQGWDLTWLWQSAGWLEGTAYPTWTGNTAITGHAYLPSGFPGPFVNLGQLSWGDEVILYANGYRYRYQVQNKELVSGDDLSILGHKDQDWLTLFTCKEYSEVLGDYRWRQVVQAVLIEVTPLE